MSDSLTQTDFTKNFLVSLAGHAGLLALAFIGGKVVTSVFKPTDIEIIRAAVRVDVVGMPKFTVQELKAMEKEPTPEPVPEENKGAKAETKTETEDVIKKGDLVIQEEGKKKKSSFLNVLSDYSAKKVSAKEKKKGAAAGPDKEHLNSLILEGNRLSKGSALVGEYSDEANSEFGAYVQTLPGIVRQFWRLPSYLMDQGLRCKIRVYVGPGGQVVKTELVQSSGNSEYDSRAEKAVRDASPFPKPSEEVAKRLTNAGIILVFPL